MASPLLLVMSEPLPVYRVQARNIAADSENRMHDDAVAAAYGFRGGLVPGVAVYAYMTVPLVECYGMAWLERGSMAVRFLQSFYDGDVVIVRGEVHEAGDSPEIELRAEREDGTLCASAKARPNDDSMPLGAAALENYPVAPLPEFASRPRATKETIVPGAPLGTLSERLDLHAFEAGDLAAIEDRLPVYRGADAIAHPMILLGLANRALMANFALDPWIHVASELVNLSAARHGETLAARGLVRDRFDRKGHEFVVLDLLIVAKDNRPVQQIRHTAIYRAARRRGC